MTIFVDSDAFVGLTKKDDSNHKKTIRLLLKLKNIAGIKFVTSNYVFSESVTVVSQRVGKETALEFISIIRNKNTVYNIHRADEETENEAIEIFKSLKSKNTSFVDCVNIAMIRKNFWDGIFSFDEIYRKCQIKYVEDLITKD